MRGEGEDSEDEDEKKKGKRRQRGGDDLDDDFMDEEAAELGGLGIGLGAGLGEDNEDGEDHSEDEDEDGSEDEDDSEDEDEEGAVSDVSESEGEEEGEEGDAEDLVPVKRHKPKKIAASGKKELPYTFSCPSTHDEFLEIIEDVEEEDIPTVVKRIRTLHHPSLAQDNKLKLQVCRRCRFFPTEF